MPLSRLPWLAPLGFLVLLCLSGLPPAAGQSQPVLTCVVCGKSPLAGKVWVHKFGHICSECIRLETRCSLCGLPVKEGFARTGDGRLICKFEVKDVVLTADEARQIFTDAALELRRLARGSMELKFPEINIGFFDVDYWNSKNGKPVQADMRRAGFSVSRSTGNVFNHSVVLLSGELKGEFAAVCAHEYTHLWINENMPATRLIEPETVEAICELSAYKLMTERHDAKQLEEIRKNPYTRGRILDLIEADLHLGWDAILNWVRHGTEPKLDITAPPSRAPAPAETASPLFTSTPAVSRTLPGRLALKGILGSGKNALALINDERFAQGEEAPVRLADKTVVVRCVEILRNAVVVTLDGTTNMVTLRLNGP